jgi:ankyrin repeat protein
MPLYSQVDNPWYLNASVTPQINSSSSQHHGVDQNLSNPGISAPAHQNLSINGQDIEGKTQLHRAAIQASMNEIRSLLINGAAVNIKDHSGNEPLHYAVISGNLVIVKDLLRFGADCNASGESGRSPLHLATSNLEIVAALLLNGATASAQDHNGDTPLHLLLPMELENHAIFTTIEKLVSSGSDINLANSAGFTPFHRLAERSKHTDHTLSLFNQFLLSGANIDFPFPDGKTPFHYFLATSNYEWLERQSRWNDEKSRNVLEQFLGKGADPLTPVETREPLAVAVIRHRLYGWDVNHAMIEFLCKKVSTGPVMPNGNSVLHELCSRSTFLYPKGPQIDEMINTLLERGADPNLRNQDGQSPLALLFDNKDNKLPTIHKIVPILLAHGANPTLTDDDGHPVLFKAAKRLTWGELKPLLRADIKQRKIVARPVVIDSHKWCYQWEQIDQAVNWEKAKDMILNCADMLPSNIEKKIRLSTLATMADKHINLVRGMFSGDASAIEKRRKLLVAILRDCRAQRIEIDMAHLDYLLELCD